MLIDHANTLKGLQQEVLEGKRKSLPEKIQTEMLAIVQQMLNLNNIKKYNDNLIGVSQIEKGGLRDFEDISGIQKSIDDLGINKTKEEYEATDIPFPYSFVQSIKDPNSMVGANLQIFDHLKK